MVETRSQASTTGKRSHEDVRFVFLQGIRVRSGTNYLGRIAACHPALQFIPPRRENKPGGELPLMASLPSVRGVFDRMMKAYIGDTPLDFSSFAREQGDALLRALAATYELEPGTVFFKDPTTEGLESFFDFFPDEKLVLLVRDGRDNVASGVKASMAKRKNMTFSHEARRYLNHWAFRDFRGHAKQWAASARRILAFDAAHKSSAHADQYLILRYEDVYSDPRMWARKLFDFMELAVEDEVLAEVEALGVVGSSYYSADQTETASKVNWVPTPRTEAFRPVERWRSWGAAKKQMFKRIAGDELLALGYATDKDW
jgi:hypothetical protein